MFSCLSGYLRFNSLDAKRRTDLQRKFRELTRLLSFSLMQPWKWVIPCLVSSTRFQCFRKVPDWHQGQTSRLEVWLSGFSRADKICACICPGPILVGLVGPVVPREKLGRVWEGWGEKPCKNLEEELGSSQTEWDSQKGSSPRGMLLGRVIEQNTRLAIKRSQA